MGCGGSKAAEVKVAPGKAPDAAPTTVQVAASQNPEEVPKPTTNGSNNNNNDSKNDGMLTEDTPGAEAVAAQGNNTDIDLEVAGSGVKKSDGDDGDDDSLRMMSATSTRSAPSIMQRPSSRGGSAFEIQWDDGNQARVPRRLEQLHHSSKRRKQDMTLDQLQKKLEAAEKRKAEYENRIKAKMAAETSKATGVAEDRKNRDLENKVVEAEDRAEENREQHFKQLRERLREKEEHARRVREKKRALENQQDQ